MKEKLTKLEDEILQAIIEITDDFGEEDKFIYDCLKEDGYNMNIVRGVIGSLVKKERIFFSEDYMGNIILRRYIYINHEVEI